MYLSVAKAKRAGSYTPFGIHPLLEKEMNADAGDWVLIAKTFQGSPMSPKPALFTIRRDKR